MKNLPLSTLSKEKPASGIQFKTKTIQNSSRGQPGVGEIPKDTQDSRAYADAQFQVPKRKSPDLSGKKDPWDDQVSIPS